MRHRPVLPLLIITDSRGVPVNNIVFALTITTLMSSTFPSSAENNASHRVPLFRSQLPAGDLEYNGEDISSRKAAQLEYFEGLDVTTLDPYPSNIWNPDYSKSIQLYNHDHHLDDLQDQLGLLESSEEFEYIEADPSVPGTLILRVRSVKTKELLYIVIGKKIHTNLMKKALLRRLGYRVPAMGYLKEFSVKFNSNYDISRLLNGYKNGVEPSFPFLVKDSPNRWVTNIHQIDQNSKKPVLCTDLEKKAKNAEADSDTKSQTNYSTKTKWVIQDPQDSEDSILRLQDALVLRREENTYALYDGVVNVSMTRKRRRAFNAIGIASSLVQLNENLNLFSWEIGTVLDGYLHLDSPKHTQYEGASVEDLIWISRKILDLKPKDFQNIAAQSHLPKEAVMLLTEKLISRRNSLRNVLKFDSGVHVPDKYRETYRSSIELPVTPNISFGKFLVNGKLLKANWSGYGSYLASSDPEERLSKRQMTELGRSKAWSTVISNAVTNINEIVFPVVEDKIALAVIDEKIDIAVENFIKFLDTGIAVPTNFSYHVEEFATAALITSRDLVTGSYLGTDNPVQLADTIGVAGRAGVFVGTNGMPNSVFLDGIAQGQLIRTYTRIKPLQDLEDARGVPFENPAVPILIHGDLPEIFKNFFESKENLNNQNKIELSKAEVVSYLQSSSKKHKKLAEKIFPTQETEYRSDEQMECVRDIPQGPTSRNLTDKERSELPKEILEKIESTMTLEENKKTKLQQMVKETMEEFTDSIAIGDSLLISDSVVGSVGLNLGYNFDENNKAKIKFNTDGILLNRLHILRSEKNTVQIYDDIGSKLALNLGIGFYIKNINFIDLSKKWVNGEANVKAYSLNIDPDMDKNPDIIENMLLLRQIIFENNVNVLESLRKPIVLTHDFFQSPTDFKFIAFKHNSLEASDEIKIKTKKGYKDHLVTAYGRTRAGIDKQNITLDVAKELIREHTGLAVSIHFPGSNDPGETIYGHSWQRQIKFDARVPLANPYPKELEDQYSLIRYRWKGWELQKDDAISVIDEIHKVVGKDLVPDSVFNSTESLQLYRIDLNIRLYEEALREFLNLKRSTVKNTLMKHGKVLHQIPYSNDQGMSEPVEDYFEEITDQVMGLKNDYWEYLEENDPRSSAETAEKMIGILQAHLKLEPFSKLIGSSEQMFVQVTIDGLRVKDQGGDKPVISNSFGRVGSKDFNGPVIQMIIDHGLSPSEALVTWILEGS